MATRRSVRVRQPSAKVAIKEEGRTFTTITSTISAESKSGEAVEERADMAAVEGASDVAAVEGLSDVTHVSGPSNITAVAGPADDVSGNSMTLQTSPLYIQAFNEITQLPPAQTDETMQQSPLKQENQAANLTSIITTNEEMTDSDLLRTATEMINTVYQRRGKTDATVEADLLDRLITASLVLEQKKQPDIIYLLAWALSSMHEDSEHLPVGSLPFDVISLILSSLCGSNAHKFHCTTSGQNVAHWIGDACLSAGENIESFVTLFNRLVFPWHQNHYYTCIREPKADAILLQTTGQYVEAETQVDLADGWTRTCVGFIEEHRQQEVVRLIRPATSQDLGVVNNDQMDSTNLENLSVVKAEETFSDEDLEGIVIAKDKMDVDMKLDTEDDEDYIGADSMDDEETEQEQSKAPRKVQPRQKVKSETHLIKRYPCKVCRKKFGLKKLRDDHVIAEHGQLEDGKFICVECQEQFLTQKELVEHVDIHRRTCKLCNYILPKRWKMKTHLAAHRDKGKCQFCKIEFASKWEMRVHIYNTHEDIRPYACEECFIRFANLQSYQEHVAVLHQKEQNRHTCEFCAKSFDFHATLVNHRRKEHPRYNTHRYSCDICNKQFRAPVRVQYHKKNIHGIDLDLTIHCMYCTETFTKKSHLVKHKSEVHPQEPPIVFCTVCPKAFASQEDMMNHYLDKHEGDESLSVNVENTMENNKEVVKSKQFQCQLCDKIFESEESRAVHSKTIHAEVKVFQCEICAMVLRSKHGFDSHMKRHRGPKQYLCDVCGKAFDTQRNCDRHKFYQHTKTLQERRKVKRFQCRQCEQKFADRQLLLRHEQRQHAGNVNFARQSCQFCQQSFTTKGTLERHIQRVHYGQKDVVRREVCTICSKNLNAASMREHMQHAHGLGKTPYRCSHCKRYFVSLENLQQHCSKPQLCVRKRRGGLTVKSNQLRSDINHAGGGEEGHLELVQEDQFNGEQLQVQEIGPDEEQYVDESQIITISNEHDPQQLHHDPQQQHIIIQSQDGEDKTFFIPAGQVEDVIHTLEDGLPVQMDPDTQEYYIITPN